MDPKAAVRAREALVDTLLDAMDDPKAAAIFARHGLLTGSAKDGYELAHLFGGEVSDWRGGGVDFFRSPQVTPAVIDELRSAGLSGMADSAASYSGHVSTYKTQPFMADLTARYGREAAIQGAASWLNSYDGKATLGSNRVVEEAAAELAESLKLLDPMQPQAHLSGNAATKLANLIEKLPVEAAETVRQQFSALGEVYPEINNTLNAAPSMRFNANVAARGTADPIHMNNMPAADVPSFYRQIGFATALSTHSNLEAVGELARAATEVLGDLPDGMTLQASHLAELRDKIVDRAANSAMAKGLISDRQFFTEVAGGILDTAIDKQYTDVMASIAKTDPQLAATLTEQINAMPEAKGAERFRQLATLTTAAEGRNAVETIRGAVAGAVEAIQPDTAKLPTGHMPSIVSAGVDAADDATRAVSGKAAKLLKLGGVLPVVGAAASVALTTMQVNAAHAYEQQGLLPAGAGADYQRRMEGLLALELADPTSVASEVAKTKEIGQFFTDHNITSPEIREALDPTLFGTRTRTDDLKAAIITAAETSPDNPALAEIARIQRDIATAPVAQLGGLQTQYETALNSALQNPRTYEAAGTNMRAAVLDSLPAQPSDRFSPKINELITANAELRAARSEEVPMREYIPGINYFTGTERRDASAARIKAAEETIERTYKEALGNGEVIRYAIRDLPPSAILPPTAATAEPAPTGEPATAEPAADHAATTPQPSIPSLVSPELRTALRTAGVTTSEKPEGQEPNGHTVAASDKHLAEQKAAAAAAV